MRQVAPSRPLLATLLVAACACSSWAQEPWQPRQRWWQSEAFQNLFTPQPPEQPQPAAPLAVLVRNPSLASGEPPYALADDRGVIQRFVEPTPTIDLAPYVGKVIRVAHDTGGTLLASQLELPPNPAALPAIDSSVLQAVAVSPLARPRVAQATAEPLPEPIVLEEVIGQPQGQPAPLQFPGPILPGGPSGANQAVSTSPNAVVYSSQAVWGPTAPRRSGLDFGAELLVLQAHDSLAVNGSDGYETGSRWTLGYDAGNGRRLAGRYFQYSADLAAGRLEMETLDLEFQRRFYPAPRVEWSIGGGLRWAEYGESAATGYSDTIGPLLTAYARAPAFGRVDGILTARQSFQFGNDSSGAGFNDRGTFSVSELQFGLERRIPLRAGDAFIRGTFETQYWNDASRIGASNNSRGLIGFGLGAGIAR